MTISTMMEDSSTEKTSNQKVYSKSGRKVRLFSACDIGVVKIHVPEGSEKGPLEDSYHGAEVEHHGLSHSSAKSEHDVGWTYQLHIDDPRSWPLWRKWMITLIVSSVSLCS